MFSNLRAEMARSGMKYRTLAEVLDVSPMTLQNKMSGKRSFKLGEMRKIQSLFPSCSLDYLFKEEE